MSVLVDEAKWGRQLVVLERNLVTLILRMPFQH